MMITAPMGQVFFEEAAELLAGYEDALVKLEQSPQDQKLINQVFRCAHTLKSNSAMLGFHVIAGLTHDLEELLGKLRAGTLTLTRPIVDTLLVAKDTMRTLLDRAKSGGDATDATEVAAAQELRARLKSLATAAASEPEQQPAPPESEWPAASSEEPTPRPVQNPSGIQRDEATTIRVPIDRVDRLINLIGELVITQSIVSQAVARLDAAQHTQLREAAAQMDRHARELHERMMAVRMVPLKQ